MTGSRPSSKAWSSVSGPVLHAPPPLATPPVTVTHTTVPTEPSLLHSNSPYRSARINNTAALRFSGFDAGPRIRPPIALEEDSRNGTGGAANARGIGIVKPPGLRAHLRASTVHARSPLPGRGTGRSPRPYTREYGYRHARQGGGGGIPPPSVRYQLSAVHIKCALPSVLRLHCNVFDVSFTLPL